MKKLLFIITVAILSITGLQAQKNKAKDTESWQKIGATTVDFKTTKNAITISAANNFKSIQIRTPDAPVHIDNLVVVYDSGDPENLPVRFDFKANAESRAINLSDSKRNIKEIDVVYRAVANTKADKATVEIWGSK